jgi:hypothetical protein
MVAIGPRPQRCPGEAPKGPQRGPRGGQERAQVGKGSCGWYFRRKKKRKEKNLKKEALGKPHGGGGRRVLLSPRGVPGRCTEAQKKVQLVAKEERKMESENGALKKAPGGPERAHGGPEGDLKGASRKLGKNPHRGPQGIPGTGPKGAQDGK